MNLYMHNGVKGNRKRVLFICYGNSCRSQMAEALANKLGHGKVRAFSAGTHPLGVISLNTRLVLTERRLSLAGHWSKGLEDVPLTKMDVVVEMGYGVNCRLPADFKGRLIRWHIPDPYLLELDYFRDVRDTIEGEVRRLLSNLARESGNLESRGSKFEKRDTKIEGGQRARKSG